VLPILIVFVLILVTSRTIADIQNRKAAPGAVHRDIVGHQWWWEIRYPELASSPPTSCTCRRAMSADDNLLFSNFNRPTVAHSFWYHSSPARRMSYRAVRNSMWFEPTPTRDLFGQLRRVRGMQHAQMLIRVIVQSPGEFEVGR